MNAAEVDRKAVLEKFMIQVAQHTLDDVSGKAALAVAQTLRSNAVVERWHLELVKLRGNTPVGTEFCRKIDSRIQEACFLERKLRADRHQKLMEESVASEPCRHEDSRSRWKYVGDKLTGATGWCPDCDQKWVLNPQTLKLEPVNILKTESTDE